MRKEGSGRVTQHEAIETRLLRVAGFGLAHAVWCISDDEVLVPFLIQERDGNRQLVRLASENLEDGVAEGRRRQRENPDEMELAVLFCDGYVKIDGPQSDAIIVEGFEYESGLHALSIYQPYRPGKAGAGFAVLRPKFDFLTPLLMTAEQASQAFFEGLYDHQQGSRVWDACFVNE